MDIIVSDADGDGIYVASDTFSTVYGAGETPDAAIKDYADNLAEQRRDLEAHENELGPALRAELIALREHAEDE